MIKKSTNKCIAIFCFYYSEGIVHDYVKYLLKQLSIISDELIMVVNGSIDKNSFYDIKKYISKIFVRKNSGFDGAAYKYVLSRITDIKIYDRIILCNDSFFGPIDDFYKILKKMTNKNYDFWGLRYVDNGLIDYLESYFLVFERSVIHSGDLLEYFNDLKDINNAGYLEICSCFERGLFSFLRSKNYRFGAYAFDNDNDIFYSADANLIKYNVPIIKRKILNFNEYGVDQFRRILYYINENSSYPIDLILEYYKYKYQKNYLEIDLKMEDTEKETNDIKIPMLKRNRKELISFIEKNPSIYIYGTGFHAGNIWFEFKYYIKKFNGFIQSDDYFIDSKILFGEKILPISKVPNGSNIILAVGQSNEKNIYNNIYKKYKIFSIWR